MTTKNKSAGARAGQKVRKSAKQKRKARDTTAERMAREWGVDARTVRRDGKFAEDVDALARVTTDDIRRAVLTGTVRLTRGQVHRLAKLSAGEQKAAIPSILADGKWRSQQAARPKPLESLQKSWERLAEAERTAFLHWLAAHQAYAALLRDAVAPGAEGEPAPRRTPRP